MLSLSELDVLTDAERAQLAFHELECARIWAAAADRRKRQALARLRAARKAARNAHAAAEDDRAGSAN